ncbi:class II aldolase/adducin family protein [Agrobacterium tumefaciens]|uniref:class II aldolase/adducin family protein n=1 Tax=Agrobacterium tumefaciens TaxID=358 RepID=UPI001571D7DD|nr:class II aldolase/adducin family protein [Agrobacterium tumefaciens]
MMKSAETKSATDVQTLIAELVQANHILFDQGVVDAFGHVSVRSSTDTNRFLLARNMAPGHVTDDDVLEFTLDGEVVNSKGQRVYLERFIHGEIYRIRPDVNSVVHSHSHSIVPLSVVRDNPLRAMFHMAGFIGAGAPVFDLADYAGGETDLLISDQDRGRALAGAFTESDIVLMRGHGSTVVGGSIQQAVYRAVYAELNAQYQVQASRLGNVKFLSPGECRTCSQNIEAQVARPWNLWCEEAAANRAK